MKKDTSWVYNPAKGRCEPSYKCPLCLDREVIEIPVRDGETFHYKDKVLHWSESGWFPGMGVAVPCPDCHWRDFETRGISQHNDRSVVNRYVHDLRQARLGLAVEGEVRIEGEAKAAAGSFTGNFGAGMPRYVPDLEPVNQGSD